MPKLTIRNLGPIKEIKDLEIKDFMVFIGPSASGKSTLAKVIYFYYSAWDELAKRTYQTFSDTLETRLSNADSRNELKVTSRIAQTLIFYLRRLFPGVTIFDNSIEITLNSGRKIFSSLGSIHSKPKISLFFDGFEKIWERELEYVNNVLLPQLQGYPRLYGGEGKSLARQELLKHFREFFLDLFELEIPQESLSFKHSIYVPATRNLLGQDLSWQKQLPADKQPFDFLTQSYLNEIEYLKSRFSGSLVSYTLESEKNISRKAEKILKGTLEVDAYKSEIQIDIFQDPDYSHLISIENMSSGQQYASGIIYPLIADISEDQQVKYRGIFIEEPEAHLFPEDQKNMVELLAAAFNTGNFKPMVITTHSPYLLLEINNLIYARQKGISNGLKKAFQGLIPEELWLDPSRCGAYLLKDGGIEDIMGEKSRLIVAEDMDETSEDIMDLFEEMNALVRESKRKDNG
ncbi:MAG: AAA family ATPase [Bacteroidota bacterium]